MMTESGYEQIFVKEFISTAEQGATLGESAETWELIRWAEITEQSVQLTVLYCHQDNLLL